MWARVIAWQVLKGRESLPARAACGSHSSVVSHPRVLDGGGSEL